jgi:hypothetical protein
VIYFFGGVVRRGWGGVRRGFELVISLNLTDNNKIDNFIGLGFFIFGRGNLQ